MVKDDPLAVLRLVFLLLALCAGTLSEPSRAAAVVIWPVDPAIAADQTSTVIWLENRGQEPLTLQVRSLGWSQPSGADSFEAQNEVVASPPVAEVAPGARQLVRLIRRAAPGAVPERSYRLIIDELPKPLDPNDAAASAKLAVQLRYSIPLFTYAGAAKAAPRLSARFVAIDGQAYAEVRNDGGAHARLTDLRLTSGNGAKMVASGLVGYVLPGATMRWALPAGSLAGSTVLVGVNGADQSLGSSI